MKILFLFGNELPERLIDEVRKRGHEVLWTKLPVIQLDMFDLVISYGYRHIIPANIIETAPPIINLHMSLLPWNRGAHPNFWAHYDGTPHGITIHLIDSGIDTGAILYQQEVDFQLDKYMTFFGTYCILQIEIETLFLNNLDEILAKKWTEKPKPLVSGSFHRVKDLPKEFRGWHSPIINEIERLKAILA